MGVKVGLAKSILSPKGTAFEFAKRTFYKSVDVSAVPFKEYFIGTQQLSAGIELAQKYKLTLSQYLTFRGFGYKVKGGVNKVL